MLQPRKTRWRIFMRSRRSKVRTAMPCAVSSPSKKHPSYKFISQTSHDEKQIRFIAHDKHFRLLSNLAGADFESDGAPGHVRRVFVPVVHLPTIAGWDCDFTFCRRINLKTQMVDRALQLSVVTHLIWILKFSQNIISCLAFLCQGWFCWMSRSTCRYSSRSSRIRCAPLKEKVESSSSTHLWIII